MMTRNQAAAIAAIVVIGTALSAAPASAGLFHHAPKPAKVDVDDAGIAAIQRAIDEQRLLDAGRLLDEAVLTGSKDPRLGLLAGELELARGRYSDALAELKQVDTAPQTRAKALESEGIALSLLGRSDAALDTLQKAVAEDPGAWRAWNALAGEYDNRRDWTRAEDAYSHAMQDSDGQAIVLNNRGFSRLLQKRLPDATDDFVAALKKKPDLATARTNLRLAMALKGEYDRATAAGASDNQAALLNNAGFAAMMRGDYAGAEDLFNRAIAAKGQYYERASDNLALAKSLAAQQQAAPSATH
jgi:Flp pilus assembly protein TadD